MLKKRALTIQKCQKIFNILMIINIQLNNYSKINIKISYKRANSFLSKKKISLIIRKIKIFFKFQKFHKFLNSKKITHKRTKIKLLNNINRKMKPKLLISDPFKTNKK